MSLRDLPAQSAFFAGTRRVQSDLIDYAPPAVSAAQCAFLAAELARLDCLPADFEHADDEPAVQFFHLVSLAHHRLLDEARFFVPETAELVSFNPAAPAMRIAVPRIVLHGNLSTNLLVGLGRFCARSISAGSPLDKGIEQLRSQVAKISRPGSNWFYFLLAAYELGMPVLEWQSRSMQIGLGDNATVLDGSITDATPAIGVSLARMKHQCNAVLAQAGFPVARGGIVASLEAAQRSASELGFPVVVKPADLDGGKAVSSDIRTAQELEQAYALAREASPNIILEKHIPGRDYRLLFYKERLLICIERIPGGVTGNGKDTIASLLEQLNAEPDRGPGPETPRYSLEFDQEAQLMLRRQGLDTSSVPDAGQYVALRRAANFARGGTVQRIDENIHPDNLDLALRAMRLLRLDLAGLDMLLPDISQSWHETGGAICEINAQPYIGKATDDNFFKQILSDRLAGEGRIPMVLVVGRLDQPLIERLTAQVPQLAVIDHTGARLNGHPLSLPGARWNQACQAPLFNSRVASVLCILDPAGPLPEGSPIDRFSAAFLLDAGSKTGDETGGSEIPQQILSLLRRAGPLLCTQADPGSALTKAGFEFAPLETRNLAAELLSALTPGSTPGQKS